MAGVLITEPFYPRLDDLWALALPTVQQTWRRQIVYRPRWSEYDVFGSVIAGDLKFAIVTDRERQMIALSALGDPVRVDDRLVHFVGPVAGLTPSQFLTVLGDCLNIWTQTLVARRPNAIVWGVVPDPWRPQMMTALDSFWPGGLQKIPILDGEWGGEDGPMTLLRGRAADCTA